MAQVHDKDRRDGGAAQAPAGGEQPEPMPMLHQLEHITITGSTPNPVTLLTDGNPAAGKGSQDNKLSWIQFLPVPICAVAYLAHARYRRLSPRILRPAFTPLSLREIYGTTACVATFIARERVIQPDPAGQRDLVTIITAAAIIRARYRRLTTPVVEIPGQEDLMRGVENINSSVIALLTKGLRFSCDPPSGSSYFGKLAHAYYSLWFDKLAWNMSSLFLSNGQNKVPDDKLTISEEDWYNTVTFMSNVCVTPDNDLSFGISRAHPFAEALCWVTPLAMVARWSGRRLLFLPFNGIQRALFYTTIFVGMTQRYQHWRSLLSIQDKVTVAEMLGRNEPESREKADKWMRKFSKSGDDTGS